MNAVITIAHYSGYAIGIKRNLRKNFKNRKNKGSIAQKCAMLPSTKSALDWNGIKTEDDFFKNLMKAKDLGMLTSTYHDLWRDFYNDYKKTVLNNDKAEQDEQFVLEMQVNIADRVFDQFKNPYKFPSFHKGIREPYDYFEFGQKYVSSLINLKQSIMGHMDRWDEIIGFIKKGHNVVLLANHQTETDAAILLYLLKFKYPDMIDKMIFVAGDRVVTDPLCIPFSMGINLFCVYSKRHINDIPEKTNEKMAMNRKTLLKMAKMMNKGGLVLWIAPSGGRDRPNEMGQWFPNEFDPSVVEIMRKLLKSSKNPGHLYPLAMVSWNLMPPPNKINKEIGEKRVTNYAGIGISLAEEIFEKNIMNSNSTVDQKEEHFFSKYIHDKVVEEYIKIEKILKNELHSHDEYSKPWHQ